jgi:predicted XRE-type DNA-binding protein
MSLDPELKRQLARELCAIINGWSQVAAAGLLRLRQPHISRLRRGHTAGFSVSRLLRLIADEGYNIEIHLRVIPRRFELPRKLPTVSIIRYDRFGRPTS